MNRRNLISWAVGAMAFTAIPALAANSLSPVEVFKNPSCGCCGAWVDHLKPAAIGIAVPGLPVGAPGMEMGSRKDPYQVLLVDQQGRERVFSSYS